MALRAGDLNRRITIEQDNATTNTYGEDAPASWGTYATRWAKVEALSGSESYGRQQRFAEADYQMTVRYDSGIEPSTMRVSWNSQTFDIEAALDPDGMKEQMHLICREEPA